MSATPPIVKDWKHFARTYTAHPLAEIFPMIDPESKDYGSLLGSISVFGVLEPIVLTRDMRVLDGRNRLRAACESVHADDAEKAPKFVFFDQLPIDHELVTERDYVASKNLSRRHLTDEQKAAAVALLFRGHTERANEARKDGLRRGTQAPKSRRGEITPTEKPTERTRDKVQREAGVSEHKARQALAVAEADPELAKKVVAGDVSLKDAAKQVGRAPKRREARSPTCVRPTRKPSTPAECLRPLADAINAVHAESHDVQTSMMAADYGVSLIDRMVERLSERDRDVLRDRLARLTMKLGGAVSEAPAEAQHYAAVAALPSKQRARFEALVDHEVQRRVQQELRERHPELVAQLEAERDAYMTKHLAAATMKASMHAILSESDYRLLLNVLHPDRAPEDRRDKFARAFDAVRKLDPYIQAVKA